MARFVKIQAASYYISQLRYSYLVVVVFLVGEVVDEDGQAV